MNIPAIVMTPVPEGTAGKTAIADGFAGKLIVEPDEDERACMYASSIAANISAKLSPVIETAYSAFTSCVSMILTTESI